MQIKSHVKVGVDVGETASRTVTTVTDGAQAALETSGREAGRLVGALGKLLTDAKFWTWPFNASK